MNISFSPATLPPALTPADCDFRDFAFMRLHVARLRDSELASNETPEACWAAVLLWAASWHQVPAAWIPKDDRWMAKQVGYGALVSKWARVRGGALRGWVKCAAGRVYHPVVAELAHKAWARKQITSRKINRRLQIESGEWAVLRAAVFARDNYTCVYCGAYGARLEADQIDPVSRGGETVMSNLSTSCRPCNSSKGTKPLVEWRQ